MPDREKVIKGLECCIPMTLRNGLADCGNCPYDRKITIDGGITECCHDLITDALALLKAQEPSDDWISRKRLKDEIQYYIDEAGWGDEVNKVLGWCLEFIDNQEAVKWEWMT